MNASTSSSCGPAGNTVSWYRKSSTVREAARDRGIDVPKLRVAVRVVSPLLGLPVALEAVVETVKKLGHFRMANGNGLRWRWVVERTCAWLNQFRRLRVRYEKRADIHEAFLSLGCALMCWQSLRKGWMIGSA